MIKPTRIVVNGRSLSRPVTGVERYVRALVNALPFEHESARTTFSGHPWEQLVLPFRVRKGQVLLSPGNTGPLAIRNQVLAVHDLAFWHHSEWFSSAFASWYRWLVPRLIRRVAHVITPSGTSRMDIIQTFGLPADKVSVVPPFIEMKCFEGSIYPGIGAPFYLMVSSLDPRKGIDRALAWYSSLDRPTFKLVIVGRKIPSFRHVGIPPHDGVIHLNDIDDARLAGLYRHAIALLQPSRFEGFGLPILEAMSLGCPVIASDLPVFRENFGDAPCYGDVGGTPLMMEAIQEMDDPARRSERIARGTGVAQQFDRERTAAALRTVLQPLLS